MMKKRLSQINCTEMLQTRLLLLFVLDDKQKNGSLSPYSFRKAFYRNIHVFSDISTGLSPVRLSSQAGGMFFLVCPETIVPSRVKSRRLLFYMYPNCPQNSRRIGLLVFYLTGDISVSCLMSRNLT